MIRMPRFFYSVLILFLVSSCAMPGLPATDVDAADTSASETLAAGQTQQALLPPPPTIAPSLTPTFTPTLIRPTPREVTATLTPTQPFILFPSSTATLETPIPSGSETATISVSVNTNCRLGPGKAYEIAGTLLVDETAEVLGRDPTGEYWYIPNPDPGEAFCWVWGEYATLTGPYLVVPVYTPIPTATSTGTPGPGMSLGIRGVGTDSCSGSWWLKIELTNKSGFTFKSVKVEMTDTVKHRSRVISSDGFTRREGCGNYPYQESLFPSDVFVIGGPTFDYNIKGNPMETTITVCTEKELKGDCVTRSLKLKP